MSSLVRGATWCIHGCRRFTKQDMGKGWNVTWNRCKICSCSLCSYTGERSDPCHIVLRPWSLRSYQSGTLVVEFGDLSGPIRKTCRRIGILRWSSPREQIISSLTWLPCCVWINSVWLGYSMIGTARSIRSTTEGDVSQIQPNDQRPGGGPDVLLCYRARARARV